MEDVTEVQFSDVSGSNAVAKILASGDPLAQLAALEQKAQLAKRHSDAINTILIAQTFPEDWTIQGGKACLGSAGAERIGRMFNIRHGADVKCVKEEFVDDHGEGYRFIYSGTASLDDRSVHVQGSYGTRDKFLGFAGGEWKPVEDINENNIRNAAYHVFCGNAIKALLGIRNIPAAQYHAMMGKTGTQTTATSTVNRGAGTQGGTVKEDHDKQKELGEICLYIANSGSTVESNGSGGFRIIDDTSTDSELERAKAICITLSSFTGKDGQVVSGLVASQLKAKRLDVTLGTARKIKAQIDEAANA